MCCCDYITEIRPECQRFVIFVDADASLADIQCSVKRPQWWPCSDGGQWPPRDRRAGRAGEPTSSRRSVIGSVGSDGAQDGGVALAATATQPHGAHAAAAALQLVQQRQCEA